VQDSPFLPGCVYQRDDTPPRTKETMRTAIQHTPKTGYGQTWPPRPTAPHRGTFAHRAASYPHPGRPANPPDAAGASRECRRCGQRVLLAPFLYPSVIITPNCLFRGPWHCHL